MARIGLEHRRTVFVRAMEWYSGRLRDVPRWRDSDAYTDWSAR
jgi:hypothetical protein